MDQTSDLAGVAMVVSVQSSCTSISGYFDLTIVSELDVDKPIFAFSASATSLNSVVPMCFFVIRYQILPLQDIIEGPHPRQIAWRGFSFFGAR